MRSAQWSKQFKLQLLSFSKMNDESCLGIHSRGPSFLAMVGVCFLYTTAADIVQRYIILELEGCNEKADMRFIFHANFIAEFLKG